jgi:hypothetical protein
MLLLLHAPVPPPRTTPVVVYVAVPVIHSGVVPLTDAIAAVGVIVIFMEELISEQGPELTIL